MGKKDFFKFPSKKTLEYILIGILFVAVLSCTMKMMKGSLNNIFEGFDCEPRTPSGTCNRISGNGGGAKIFTGSINMDDQRQDELNGEMLFKFIRENSSEVDIVVAIPNTTGTDVNPDQLIGLINDQITAENINDIIVFKGSVDNKLNFITLPGSNYQDIMIQYTSNGVVGGHNTADQQTFAERIFGINGQTGYRITLTPITCQELFDKLEGNYDPRTDTGANAPIRLGGVVTCLSVCEEESLGECPTDSNNSGCALNDSSDQCECGGSAGLGSFVHHSSDLNFGSTVSNCLKHQITEIYGSDGTLGTQSW